MRFQSRLDGFTVGGQRFGRAAPHFPVADPAARLHYAGSREILQIDHHPRGQAVEVARTVWLVRQYPSQFQGFRADVDIITDLQINGWKQSRLGPGFTGPGAAASLLGLIQVRCAFKLAAQWVSVIHRLDAGQLDTGIGGDHAGKDHDLRMLELQALAFLDLLGARRAGTLKNQISAKKLGRPQQHCAVQARAEITDGGAGSHGYQKGKEQHPQLSGACIAQQLAGGEA